MDYWAENQGHLTQYNKFNTVPSRSCTQNYHDRQLAPQFPVYYGEQQHKPMHSGYWPSRDVPNWTNQETANMTSSPNFPFGFGHPIQRHYSDVGEQQRQEARDWATYQQQQERGMPREGWPFNPAHCKRDLSKKNESNFRELEAWALRYSHSLPRRRRIEAELRGTRQDNIERRDMQMLNVQDSTQWDGASRQQAPKYCQTTPASPCFDVKDKLSYQTKLSSHPPNYNAPPPYSVQFRSVSTPHKFENQMKSQQVLKPLEREMFVKCSSKVETRDLDTSQVNRQLAQGRPSSEAAKVIEGRKFRLNKKAGGMTIFCLVSRIADTDSESEQISRRHSDVHSKNSSASQPLKLADEVDFKIQTPTKHVRSPYSKLQAIPICQESLSKMAEKSVPKTSEVSAYEKLAAQSKYPLWRRPSFTSNTESDNGPVTCSKDSSESNLIDQENGRQADKERTQHAKDDAMLMIDTTCVVVKLEVLQGPKMEQVHYLGSVQCNQPDLGQAEDAKALPEQEAKGINVVEKALREDVLTENSKSICETLEERAQRICGLRDSTMMQLQEEIELAVEKIPMKNDNTNESKDDMDSKELHNVSTLNQVENMQPEEVSICKDEVIGEAGASKENIKENGKDLEKYSQEQNFIMVANVEQEKNSEAAVSGHLEEQVEINNSTDIANSLAESKEERENKTSAAQFESSLQVNVQNDEGLAEADEDMESFGVYENTTTQSTLLEANTEILSDEEQEATQEVSDGELDEQNTVEKLANHELGELSNPNPEVESSERVEVYRSNSDSDDGDEDSDPTAQENLQQLDSGQVEDMPVSEILSQSEQNHDKQLTEEANEEMQGNNIIKPEFELEDEVSCINKSFKDSIDIDIATSDLEIRCIAEKVIELQDVQADIRAASTVEDIEQTSQLDSSDDLKEHVQFGCHKKVHVNEEEGLYNVKNTEKKLSSVSAHKNQGPIQSPVIDPKVVIPSEDFEQSQDKELIDNVNKEGLSDQASHIHVSDIGGTTSHSEMCEEVVLKDNTTYEKEEEDEISPKSDLILEEILQKSDILETMHKDEKAEFIEPVKKQEIAGAASANGLPEDSAFLEADHQEAKEPEIQKDMELMLVKTDRIVVSGDKVQDFDWQQCECEDATIKSCVDEEEFIKDNGKHDQDTKMCQSTNTRKEASGGNLGCHADPNVNDHAGILETSSSSADHSQQSIPSVSTCDYNFENASCEEDGKYPKSLRDAVNRIRKHTAPDSENEEEEVLDSWDRESLADNIVSYENVFDKDYIDIKQGMVVDQDLEDLNMEDDTCSQCSNTSQESDGTIVDDELEELANVESTDICNENRGSDGEAKCENEPQNEEETVIETGQTEERLDQEALMPDEIML